ncbi:MAG: polyprenol monophosphomannose synthase [Candidatus Coatesbacteria bacterium]|nr:polyprenol monophosphomannose synthase [Candidatus Coatesbacteria bacterium]
MGEKVIITIPTYNEADNIGFLLEDILEKAPESITIVIDDDSPDGTAEIVKDYQKRFPLSFILVSRKEKRGRGYAGREGFIKALELDADYIIEMDADFSHNPKFIPDLLEPLRKGEADMVLGSRKVGNQKDDKRGLIRPLITFLAGNYIRILLGTKIKDVTSGYRAYTRNSLLTINPFELKASSPDIVEEVLYRAIKKNLRIKEVRIVFEDRIRGKSTFNFNIMKKVLLSVLKLRLKGSL